MWFPLILLTCLIVVQELYFEKNYSNLLIISVMAWGFSSCLESLFSWHNFKNALHFPLTYLQLFPFPSLPFPSYLFAVFNPSSINFCYYVRHWLLTFASRIVEYGRGPAMPLSPIKNFAGTCRPAAAGAELVPEADRYLNPSGSGGEASYISESFQMC